MRSLPLLLAPLAATFSFWADFRVANLLLTFFSAGGSIFERF